MIGFRECVEKGLLRRIPPSREKAVQSIEKAKQLLEEAKEAKKKAKKEWKERKCATK